MLLAVMADGDLEDCATVVKVMKPNGSVDIGSGFELEDGASIEVNIRRIIATSRNVVPHGK